MLPTAVRIGVLCEDEGGGEVTELEMTETGVVGVDRRDDELSSVEDLVAQVGALLGGGRQEGDPILRCSRGLQCSFDCLDVSYRLSSFSISLTTTSLLHSGL